MVIETIKAETSRLDVNKSPIASAIHIESSTSDVEYFPGACREEIGSVMMQDIVGDYDVPDSVPEWGWVEKVACFNHARNGNDGVWEFVINLSNTLQDIPDKLKPVLKEAMSKNLAYLIFHQGT